MNNYKRKKKFYKDGDIIRTKNHGVVSIVHAYSNGFSFTVKDLKDNLDTVTKDQIIEKI